MAVFSGKPLELAQIASVSVKALPWAFFVGTLKFSVGSLVANMNLVKKIYFPRVNIALGSLAETEYLLEFCLRLGYLTEKGYKRLEDLRSEVGALLWNFYQSL